MLRLFSIVNLITLITIFSIFAISNTHFIVLNIFTYRIEIPLYIFSFINSFLFFIVGGFCGMGYNIMKNYKIFKLNKKINKLSNKDTL